ncbi:MAG: TonB family protein [Chitinispirillia bacterium]|nr:TonB family protein [Chitinispirillia bacterium]MCL2242479.1 TonB family protein [Chitinispirillia bacterium]
MTKMPASIKIVLLALLPAFVAGCAGKLTSTAGKGATAAETAEIITPQPDTRWYSANPNATRFSISTADELAGLAQIVNGTWGGTPERDDFYGDTVRLAKDIDLSRYDNWVPIGDFSADSSSAFFGAFDGAGRTISNLTINRPGADCQGLFGYLRSGLKNLRLYGANVSGRRHAGRLAGRYGYNLRLDNCLLVGGTLSGSDTAGILEANIDSIPGRYFVSNPYAPFSVRRQWFGAGSGNYCGSRNMGSSGYGHDIAIAAAYYWCYSEDFGTPAGASKAGSRGREEIRRIIDHNTDDLRIAYDARLRDKPDLSGKITVRFTINQSGSVIIAQTAESAMDDPEFEATVAETVKRWNFEKFTPAISGEDTGDITEVVYPFTFPLAAKDLDSDL